MSKIAILHYAGPPGIGGVESTIAYQARGLIQLGYSVRVVSGSGAAFAGGVETYVDPMFSSTDPRILTAKAELDKGIVSADFWALVEALTPALRSALADCSVCIAHNIPTLHKNLALTVALARLNSERAVRVIAWCNDLAWTNPQYVSELHSGFPWNLLRCAWEKVSYVTISEPRQSEMAALFNMPLDQIAVIVPGIDPPRFWRWTPDMQMLEDRLHLLDADGLLLIPARLTRRKNIEMGIRVLASIRRQSGTDFRLIVTGPPGPHNPGNKTYLAELNKLRHELGVEQTVHFLYSHGDDPERPFIPDDDTIAALYQLADALFFPSLEEGFGIPILEAGLMRLPIFCADIPPLRSTGQADVSYFDPLLDSPDQIATRVLHALADAPAYRLAHRVRRQFRWDRLIADRLVPLLEGSHRERIDL